MHALVTGASGFIGQALADQISSKFPGCHIHLAYRNQPTRTPAYPFSIVGDLAADTDWYEALHDCDVVVHCAARVHIMKDTALDPLSEFRLANVIGTSNLAHQAAEAGVKRFVFISSIKVNGERTEPGKPYTADDHPAPVDPYGISKHEAEQALQQIAQATNMEVTIIRPPLVYGPGVKSNFAAIMKWMAKGTPLPLGALRHNRRSFVSLDNLLDLIITCLDHPSAANQIFLAGDGEDLSTTELLQRVAQAMHRNPRLIPIPEWLLVPTLSLLGKIDIAEKLCGSLQLDISKAERLLSWTPPLSVNEGIKRTVASTS
ncbi:MAG: SDR family oxidoreductase [Candidatus Thiodiazotropha sp. (ex Monitilora ramsayi)]|nr:SDR family oxidoreductase [Candidatus Thiodiazotropha sp. (ex Monitilora ramsayi)]